MKCAVCGGEFLARRKTKTCSPKCSAALKTRRERTYHLAHPRATERRKGWEPRASVHRKINRAVRLLFALTGETHYE